MLKKIIAKVQENKLFADYKQSHPAAFLAHVFVQDNSVQIGFYDTQSQLMTTFLVEGEKIECMPDQEVLRKEGDIVKLDIDRVSLEPFGANKIFLETAKKEYPKEILQKIFIILQQIADEPIYNITALTASLNTVNIKLSAVDGNIIKTSCERLMQEFK